MAFNHRLNKQRGWLTTGISNMLLIIKSSKLDKNIEIELKQFSNYCSRKWTSFRDVFFNNLV